MIKKRTSARMARLVRQWRQSGESQASFARHHQIPTWTFWYWCRKLAAEPKPTRDDVPAPTFVPVRMATDTPAPVIEIVLSGGERLHIRAEASADLVRAVMTALRARC